MPDSLTRSERSERMGRIRHKNTKPELVVRRTVHRLGFRFRLHRKDLPGNPDLVFPSRRKVLFVHGCFWHRHPDPACPLARWPKSKLGFWRPKLEANRIRDVRNQQALERCGWRFLVVWECQLRDKERLENELRRFLAGDRCDPSNCSPVRGDSALA